MRLMNFILIFILTFIFSILLIGCSSGMKKNKNAEIFVKNLKKQKIETLQYKTSSCSVRGINNVNDWKLLVKMANKCVEDKKWSNVEVISERMLKLNSISPWGNYFLSISLEHSGNLPKSLALIEYALRKTDEIDIFYHQKFRILLKMGLVDEAQIFKDKFNIKN